MKRRLFKIAVIFTAVGVVGVLVMVSGVIPLKASGGHWRLTRWILKFSMQRSITTHSLGIKPPALDDRGLILKGAGHYETGCRSCHGSPGTLLPRIAGSMLPTPPDLRRVVQEREDRELFYVVKHGMKFTGMPAWPAQQRDDEVWAVVAFLRQLPSLDEAGYRRLVHGEPAPTAPIQTMAPPAPAPEIPSAVVQTCARCHGHDGLGRGTDVFPKLAGQRREYLHNALDAYAHGKRHSGIMGPIAAGLSVDMIAQLAGYYSRLAAAPTADSREKNADAIARGRAIAHEGVPAQRVPSCIDCHGAEGRRAKPAYPLLAGQPAAYLELQLQLLKEDHRGGSAYAHLMRSVAPRLTAVQMRDVALYFESLPTPRGEPAQNSR